MSEDIQALAFLRRIAEQSELDGFERVITEVRSWLDQVVDNPPTETDESIPHNHVPMPRLRKNRHNFYCVPVPMPNGRSRLVSTGSTNLIDAKRVVQEAGVDRLVLLARSGAMTADSVVLATTGRRMNCESLFTLWSEDLAVNSARSTVEKYQYFVRKFFDFAGSWNRPLVWVQLKKLSDFVNQDGKFSVRVLRKSSLASLYRFAQNRGYVIGNLMNSVVIRHQEMRFEDKEKVSALPFTEAEYRRILACNLSRFWRAAVIISWWTGMRLSDISMLAPSQIQETCLICWTLKRRHRIALPFSEPLIGSPELVECLRELKADPFTPEHCFEESFFRELRGNCSNLSVTFRRTLDKIGINFKSFHGLRSSAINRFNAAGVTLKNIGRLVGHANESTTAGYVHEQ